MKKLLYAILGIKVLLMALFFIFLYTPDVSIGDIKKVYATDQSEFVTIDGMEVHFRSEGVGEPILLLHGTSSSLHTWEPWVDMLKDSFQVITFDLPGFALTGPHPERTYTTAAYNSVINGLTDYLGLTKFSIGGNSLGGYISWNYAIDHPGKVDKLILIDPAGFPTEPVALFKLISNPLLGPILSKVSVRSLVEKNLKEVYHNDALITDALIDRYYDMSLREGNRKALVDRVKRREASRVERLAEIPAKTLIMWGDKDYWIPVDHAQKYCDRIENCVIKIYKAGHLPMEELPTETGADAMRFLMDMNL